MLQLSSILYTSYNVRQIIFGQVLKRDNLPKHLSDFNDKVATFNIVFHARCSDDRLPFHQYVTFWKHRGFWNSCTPGLSDDGLHLSDAGLIKHYFSVSRALVFVHNKVLTTGGGYSSLGPPQWFYACIYYNNISVQFYDTEEPGNLFLSRDNFTYSLEQSSHQICCLHSICFLCLAVSQLCDGGDELSLVYARW